MSTDSYPRSYFGDQPEIPEITIPVTKAEIEEVSTPQAKPRKKIDQKKVAQNKAERQKLAMYAKQEAKRAPKVQIDQRLILWTWITGIVIAFFASAVVSFNGITAVAQFVGLSADWIGYLFFFFIELMYLLFLIAYLLLASRVDEEGNNERTAGAFWGMFSFGAIAVIANAFHTIDFWQYDFTEPRLWAGTVLAVAAPIAIISASKMASRVVFAKAIRL
jgi:hypothetical protein